MSQGAGLHVTIFIPQTLGLVLLLQVAPTLNSFESKPSPDWDAKFQQRDGWTGGDGAYSVALSPDRTAWLFSDSFVGKVRDGKRTDATMVNNAVAIQEGHGAEARLRFVVPTGADGKPTALLKPPVGHGWFWIADGLLVDGKLFLFLPQIEKKAGDNSAFGFQQVGEWLATVANPLDDPALWRVTYQKLPSFEISKDRNVIFGAAVMRSGEDVFIYGVDEIAAWPFPNKRMILARVPANSLAEFSAWRFYRDGEWVTDFRKASHLTDGMANEFSVSYQQESKQFLAVYSDHGMSDRIMARASKTPWGPWSKPVVLFTCPEMKRDKKVFCYAAKAHPSESSPDGLLVSYVVNSFDFWQVARDASLYWPRFVTVKFAREGRTP